MRSYIGWVTAVILAAGCSARPPLSAEATGRLQLDLTGLLHPHRGLLDLPVGPQTRVTIDAPGSTPTTYTVATPSDGVGQRLALPSVPLGHDCILTVENLGDTANVLLGAAVVDLLPGDNAIALTPASQVSAGLAKALLQHDRASGTQQLTALKPAELDAFAYAVLTASKVVSPALVDVAGLAAAVVKAGGKLSPEPSQFRLAPGRIVLSRPDWPADAAFAAAVNDRASLPAEAHGSGDVTLEGVAPGTWTLSFGSPSGVTTLPVTVLAGQDTRLTVHLADLAAGALPLAGTPSTALASLASGFGGAATAVLAGADALWLVGGSHATGEPIVFGAPLPQVTDFQTRLWRYSPGHDVEPVLTLTGGGRAAAIAHGNELYWFGTGSPGAWHLDPTDPLAQPLALDPLPLADPDAGIDCASAAELNGLIYVAGGVDAFKARAPITEILALDPAKQAWVTSPVPAPTSPAADMASAVVDGRWYLMGGWRTDLVASNGGPVSLPVPTSDGQVLDPALGWSALPPMPTARAGAGVAVVGTQIWVVGGYTRYGTASAAIESYDTQTAAWTRHLPLSAARAYPQVATLGGKVIVMGGLRDYGLQSTPIATVEEFQP